MIYIALAAHAPLPGRSSSACEFIFLKDNYGSARMNTLFKFHFPAWLLFGVGLPYLIYVAIRREKNDAIQMDCVHTGFSSRLCFSLIGPVYLFSSLFLMPNTQTSLDALHNLRQTQPTHIEIIQWLRHNSEPTDRILEVPGCAYRSENRVSIYAGRPTLLGWVNHESVWRGHKPEIFTRKNAIMRFYTTPNWEEAKAFLKQYEIKYVVFSFPDPECKDTYAQLPQMKLGAYRRHLQPIIGQRDGMVLPFELYRVPDNL